MKCFMYLMLSFVLSSNGLARQGVYVPPEESAAAPYERVVRMTLGDNKQSPIIDIGVQGPTVAIFPADVSYCSHTSAAFGWKKGGGTEMAGSQWFREIVFNLTINPGSLSPAEQKTLQTVPVSFICRLQSGGKNIYREIRLRFNPVRYRAVVFLDNPSQLKKASKKLFDASMFKGFQYVRLENGKPVTNLNPLGTKPYHLGPFKKRGFEVIEKGEKNG